MFKIVKNKNQSIIVNSDNETVYMPPQFIAFKNYDLSKLVNALNKKGYRDIELIVAFESGKLR